MATLLSVQELSSECKKCNEKENDEGQFKATNVWNSVILHLKDNVDVQTRKHRKKTYQDCFVGSDAVDIVLRFLIQDGRIHQNITREKVTKLCKYFLENNILIDAESIDSTKAVFADSPSHYYRFSDVVHNSYLRTDCSCKSKGHHGFSSNQPFQRLTKRRSFGKGKSMKYEIGSGVPERRVTPLATVQPLPSPEVLEGIFSTADIMPKPSPLIQRSSRLLSSFKRSKREDKKSISTGNASFSQEKNDIWQEVIIQRLLHLMEIPVLENILSCAAECHYEQYSPQKEKRPASTKNSDDGSLDSDPWIKAAIRCLENQSDVIPIISHCHAQAQNLDSPDVAYKIYLYKYICELCSAGPLVPNQLLDVLSAILGALANGKTSRAIELSQLCFLLVNDNDRDRLTRLVEFMAIAGNSKQVRLDVKTANRATILKAFVPVLVHSPLLSPSQSSNLVSFWLDCHTKVLQVPLTVHNRAMYRVNAARLGLPYNNIISYCQRISREEYHQQRISFTQKALLDLTNHIIDDTDTPLKDKKQHLKNLQKNHQVIFDGHFADML